MAWLLGARAFLARLPREVWYVLALAVALWLGVRWYNGQITDAENRGAAAEAKRIEAKALAIKAKADALNQQIAAAIRNRNNEQTRVIAARADVIRVSGPGKASCGSVASVPAVASRQQPPARPGSPAVDRVPDPPRVDIIGLPFADTVAFAEQHDRCRADLLSYREWEKQVREAWPKP